MSVDLPGLNELVASAHDYSIHQASDSGCSGPRRKNFANMSYLHVVYIWSATGNLITSFADNLHCVLVATVTFLVCIHTFYHDELIEKSE